MNKETTKYHKWTINDGDYIRKEEDIHISRPESLSKQLKRKAFGIIWKVSLVCLLIILFLKFI